MQDCRGELERFRKNAARWASSDARHTATTARTAKMSTMKRVLKTLAIAGVAVLGLVANGEAQVQQTINFSLTLYNQTDTGVRALRISTRDVIENLAGTNVPGGRLLLVMPTDPSPDGGNGNISAFLRVTDSRGNIIAETTSDSFNIYQTFSSQAGTRTIAWNQFSLSFGGLGAELYGTATWSKSSGGAGGQGSFRCTVSGHCGLGDITNVEVPCTGTITGGAPRPAS
jgi:hypothetical protein